ncbi:hypothetical protein B0T10DRAFT_496050 [Thelonectria olida]|uniref:Uncharacterized protein n=1 Tax=Thelonectria olida TaxID=1576542 RepID=A0A9P8VV76_9HYPO|nr:hypothetical protein B0T10DRAFT_496050 [Thelonectria olida]
MDRIHVLSDIKSFSPSSLPYIPTQTPANLPMMCYIGKNQFASIRGNLFRVALGPGRSWNEPASRLQQLRQRQLAPSNSDQDAYFIGIFLAMAQRHSHPLVRCPLHQHMENR